MMRSAGLMGMDGISDRVRGLAERALQDVAGRFSEIDMIAQANAEKVLAAFGRHRVSESCFAGTTGYGYNDKGRDTLDRMFADVMGTQTALVRTGFVNGTHAITTALFAALAPGQKLLSVTGIPYDTLRGVIGIS
ncbi:MAG: methionine gamma-lyase family protein, partial [Oscillospiraceae bacterium]|nr:methionine gamma-lyase family protein [Oscillospiraceae bacterium]